MYIKTLTVSNLNGYIKKIIDNDFILKNVHIKGELSNFKWHDNGNIFFSLKDDSAKIRCVMFKSNTSNINFIPKDGMSVILKGRISIYSKEGIYQLYCEEIELDGIGELYADFEKLKIKLQNQGIFDEEHKLPIPKYCEKIGVITAPTGAAVHDIINVVKRRNKNVDIAIYPSLVQGINASKNIIQGIKKFNKLKNVEVIIIARGGGSIEELWAFNDEDLACEIYKSKIPIVTGVGHETDFTIVDFVSDKRAPTPSTAAEVVTPRYIDLQNEILKYREKLNNYTYIYLNDEYKKLEFLKNKVQLNNPINYITNKHNIVDNLRKRIEYIMLNKFNIEEKRLENINNMLLANNPITLLKKGYSIVEDKNNNVISSVKTLKKCEDINITFADGKANVKIKAVKQ